MRGSARRFKRRPPSRAGPGCRSNSRRSSPPHRIDRADLLVARLLQRPAHHGFHRHPDRQRIGQHDRGLEIAELADLQEPRGLAEAVFASSLSSYGGADLLCSEHWLDRIQFDAPHVSGESVEQILLQFGRNIQGIDPAADECEMFFGSPVLLSL